MFFKVGCSGKFWKFHRKTAVLESLFNKVAGLKTCNIIKKRLQHRYSPVKFLRTTLSQKTSSGCFWTNPRVPCGSFCSKAILWSFSTILSKFSNFKLNLLTKALLKFHCCSSWSMQHFTVDLSYIVDFQWAMF